MSDPTWQVVGLAEGEAALYAIPVGLPRNGHPR